MTKALTTQSDDGVEKTEVIVEDVEEEEEEVEENREEDDEKERNEDEELTNNRVMRCESPGNCDEEMGKK